MARHADLAEREGGGPCYPGFARGGLIGVCVLEGGRGLRRERAERWGKVSGLVFDDES